MKTPDQSPLNDGQTLFAQEEAALSRLQAFFGNPKVTELLTEIEADALLVQTYFNMLNPGAGDKVFAQFINFISQSALDLEPETRKPTPRRDELLRDVFSSLP